MTTPPNSLELARLCASVLEEKKAGDLRLLDVSGQSSITNYMLVATATSEPHLRALRVELEKAVDATGTRIVGIESPRESGWIVVDLFDVMVHLFLPELRARYRLESLWKDAAEVSASATAHAPAPKPRARRRASARKPAKKPARAGSKPVARKKRKT